MDTSAVGFTSSSSSLTSSSQMSHRNDDNSNTTVTFVKATLGREASIHCIAEHLVGQKTVSFHFQRGLKKTSYRIDSLERIYAQKMLPHSAQWAKMFQNQTNLKA